MGNFCANYVDDDRKFFLVSAAAVLSQILFNFSDVIGTCEFLHSEMMNKLDLNWVCTLCRSSQLRVN